MGQIWEWFTDLGNSKIVALLLFFGTFIGILIYVFASKKRSERLESYKFIPLQDEERVGESKKADENHDRD